MMTRVLDTGVVAKWFLKERGSDRADRYLDELTRGSLRVAVPSLLYYELAEVLWGHRDQCVGETEALSLWTGLQALPLTVVPWEDLLPRTLPLGFRHGISPSDASFVLLARDLGCDLITADRALFLRLRTSCPWVQAL